MILIAKNPPKQDDGDVEDLQRHLNIVKNKLTELARYDNL